MNEATLFFFCSIEIVDSLFIALSSKTLTQIEDCFIIVFAYFRPFNFLTTELGRAMHRHKNFWFSLQASHHLWIASSKIN